MNCSLRRVDRRNGSIQHRDWRGVRDRRRANRPGSEDASVRIASAIEPEWLVDHVSDQVVSREVEWNRSAERVGERQRAMLARLRSSRAAARGLDAATELARRQSVGSRLERFAIPWEIDAFAAR